MTRALRDLHLQSVGTNDCIGRCEKGDKERVGMNGEVRSTPDIALSGLGEQEGGSGPQQHCGLWSCVRENDPKVRCKIYVTRSQGNWEDPYLLLPLDNPFTASGCPWTRT